MTTIFVFIVYRIKRLHASRKARNYSEHYLRRTNMALKMGSSGSGRRIIDGVGDTFATGVGEQKCIRDEVAKRRLLKTFSPVRKEFYVTSASDLHGVGGGGSLMRTLHDEPLYQQGLNHHDVLHHNHPYVGQNFGTSNSPQVISSPRNNIQNHHHQNHYHQHHQSLKDHQQQHQTVQNMGSSEYNNNNNNFSHTSPYHHNQQHSSTLPSPSASYHYQHHQPNPYSSRGEMIGPLKQHQLLDNSGTMVSKCSHGSRYQVPFMVRHDSKKSSLSSQQSSFFNSSLATE